MSRLLKDRLQQHSTPGVIPYDQIESFTLVDECSDAESSSSHGVSWWNLTTPCCVQGNRQRHDSGSHDLQSENVLLLVIFQTYGVTRHHDVHSYVCSMGLWFLLHTVCCNYCKRSDRQHSLLCSLCSVSVLQWPQKMTSQYQQSLSFCSIDIFFF